MDDQEKGVPIDSQRAHRALTLLSFEINDDNMRDLACLSDKYIINSLQNDVRVSPF